MMSLRMTAEHSEVACADARNGKSVDVWFCLPLTIDYKLQFFYNNDNRCFVSDFRSLVNFPRRSVMIAALFASKLQNANTIILIRFGLNVINYFALFTTFESNLSTRVVVMTLAETEGTDYLHFEFLEI